MTHLSSIRSHFSSPLLIRGGLNIAGPWKFVAILLLIRSVLAMASKGALLALLLSVTNYAGMPGSWLALVCLNGGGEGLGRA